jgi:hypothetical protein
MAARHGLLLFVDVIGGPNLADLPTEEIVRQLLRATKTPPRFAEIVFSGKEVHRGEGSKDDLVYTAGGAYMPPFGMYAIIAR